MWFGDKVQISLVRESSELVLQSHAKIINSDRVNIKFHVMLCYTGTVIETRECGGKLKSDVFYDTCTTRMLGDGASVTVCHCLEDGCNLHSVHNSNHHWNCWSLFEITL